MISLKGAKHFKPKNKKYEKASLTVQQRTQKDWTKLKKTIEKKRRNWEKITEWNNNIKNWWKEKGTRETQKSKANNIRRKKKKWNIRT